MEIYMDNIPWTMNRYEVIRQLASLLHGEPFASFSPSRINFHVTLIRSKGGGRGHGGKGFLTLPTREIGHHFLYLSTIPAFPFPFHLAGRRLKFFPSNHPDGKPNILEDIRHSPYVDPQAQEEREGRIAEFKNSAIDIAKLQFGWECRDQVFSIEWEHPCEGSCRLEFDEEKDPRQILITFLHERHGYIVAIPYSHLFSTYVHPSNLGEPAIVFVLSLPPIYQLNSMEKRLRLAYLPFGEHDRVAPFTSLAIRVVCSHATGPNEFHSLARRAQLQHIYRDEYPVDRRQLFSAQRSDALTRWLRYFNWTVGFQILALVQSLLLDLQEVLELMPTINNINTRKGPDFTAAILRKLGSSLKMLRIDDVSKEDGLLARLSRMEAEYHDQTQVLPRQPPDPNLCDVFHVMITPTTMDLEGPTPERSNRILRRYKDNQDSFLRVSFLDEGGLKYRFDRDMDGPAFIRSRVGPFLLEGLTLTQRKFKFLAYSQSALKQHCVWFVKPFFDHETKQTITAEKIIQKIGKFDNLSFDKDLMKCPARYAARISQAFTATDVSIRIEAEEIFEDLDISSSDGKYHFTDGVGTISPELAQDIVLVSKKERKRHRNVKVSAFQIRFMGTKGMLSVDYALSGRAVTLRQSMIKFEAPDSLELEIARLFDKPGLYYLNRPLIMLLEGLGVPYETFKKYQDIAIEETEKACLSLRQAARLLESYGLGTSYRLPSILLNLENLYIDSLFDNPFYNKILDYSINHVLRQLKNHARIPIPGAWTLVGVADVHRFLAPDEIFACVKPINGKAVYLKGPILISRSPTIHPGDVKIVFAIGTPPVSSPFEKETLPNTVVFSVLGDRPIPSCLGGGDLDGDVYNLIPLNNLPDFAPIYTPEPASYEPAPKKLLENGRTCEMKDVADFIMEYINSDVLGMIATNWLIIADQTHNVQGDSPSSRTGIFADECLLLAQLHSDAVDYPKTGNPVKIDRIPRRRRRERPDWNAPETLGNKGSADYYDSATAIGRLYREVHLPAEDPTFRKTSRRPGRTLAPSPVESDDSELDNDLLTGFQQLRVNQNSDDVLFTAVREKVKEYITTSEPPTSELALIDQLFHAYAEELGGICATHTITTSRNSVLSEEEVITGTIAQKTPQPRKRKDMMTKLHESTDILVHRTRNILASDDDLSSEDSLKRAWAAWKFALRKGETFGAQSFSWVCLGAIFEALKEIDSQDNARIREMWF